MLTAITNPIVKRIVMVVVTAALILGMCALSTESASAATKGSHITKSESSSYCKVVLKDKSKPAYVTFKCKSWSGPNTANKAKIVLRDNKNRWICEWVAKDGDKFYLGNNYSEYRIYIKTPSGAQVQYSDYSFTNPQNATIS